MSWFFIKVSIKIGELAFLNGLWTVLKVRVYQNNSHKDYQLTVNMVKALGKIPNQIENEIQN